MNSSELEIDFDAIELAENRRKGGRGYLIGLFAVLMSALWIVPYYYLLVSIFKSTPEYAVSHPLGLPQGLWPVVDNALAVWNEAKLGVGMLNSLFYGIVGGGLAIFFAAMAAFGLTRFNMRGEHLWFLLIFSGTVFPLQMYLVPLFFGYAKIGLLHTHFGMALFYTAICIPFPTLVLRTYMAAISREVDEAARLDGAGEFSLFLKIMLPQCWGPLTATFLFQFTWIWNDLLFTIVLGNKSEVRGVMNGIQVLAGQYSAHGPNVILTAALMASAPTLILFFLLRKRFMSGLTVAAS